MTAVGFEPTPFRTSALSWRLRPLGHAVFWQSRAGTHRTSNEKMRTAVVGLQAITRRHSGKDRSMIALLDESSYGSVGQRVSLIS